MESISLNVEAVNTHRERPEVGKRAPKRPACAFQGSCSLLTLELSVEIQCCSFITVCCAVATSAADFCEGLGEDCLRTEQKLVFLCRCVSASLGRGVPAELLCPDSPELCLSL